MASIPITLSRPILAHGEEKKSILLREPNGKDIAACGYPFTIAAHLEPRISGAEMRAMIAACAGIPPSSVDQLAANDFNMLAMHILGFFLVENQVGGTSDTTKSPGSSAADLATSST